MTEAALTISIDLELAWGNWDNLEREHVDHVERLERPIVNRLVELLDAREVPVTWAFVAALLDPASAAERPGPERLWYAPDVIEAIRGANAGHDLGSHGGRHRYFDSMDDAAADEELRFARSIHDRHGLPFTSFVYPRNKVARPALLHQHGVRVYRGTDRAWHERLRSRFEPAGRLAALADKMIATAPEAVAPERTNGLVNLPGSMLFFGRQGIRNLVPGTTISKKLSAGLDAAIASEQTFHLWFHPSNFWYETDKQFEIFERFLDEVVALRDLGKLSIKPMAAFA